MAIRLGYDFCPEEADEYVVETKKGRKVHAPADVQPEVLLDQEHMVSTGRIVVSHLLALPKGMQPNDTLRKLFTQHPFDAEARRDKWGVISDKDLASQRPQHDIWWLCRADYLDGPLVQGIVDLALKTSKPKRKINNAVPVG